MRASETSPENFFSGNCQFVSPSFQRPYSWIRGACARVFDAVVRNDASLAYQGSIVSMDLGKSPHGCSKSLLIDGTQRLMTVLIMLLALRDALKAVNKDSASKITENFFINSKSHEAHHFKNIVPKKNRPTFESLVNEESAPSPACPVLRAYKYYEEKLQEASEASLQRYVARLARELTFIHLALDRDEDPYPIFKLLSTPGEPFTNKGLSEYTRFASDPELMALIAGGESQDVEFKESVVNRDRQDLSGTSAVTRSVAGFMNSFAGGTLLIGVRDDGTVRGIEHEYAIVDKGKKNWDGFSLYISNILRTRLSTQNAFLFFSIEPRKAMNHDVCIIYVKPATAPVYIDKHLFVRSNSQTLEMIGPDLVDYVAARWPKL
jgi:hypothetical protein